MKNSIISLVSLFMILGCNKQEDYKTEKFLNQGVEKDSVTIDIVRFIIPTYEFSKGSRFSDSLRTDINERLSFFNLIYYYPSTDSIYYYLISKKAASIKNEVIGVGGYYKVKNKQIAQFVEVFNTPKMSQEELQKKGIVLFKELLKEGNINRYVSNKSLVEFPDQRTYYDSENNQWKVKTN